MENIITGANIIKGYGKELIHKIRESVNVKNKIRWQGEGSTIRDEIISLDCGKDVLCTVIYDKDKPGDEFIAIIGMDDSGAFEL
jgi:hypothetical protein